MMATCATSGLVALALLVNLNASVFYFQLLAKINLLVNLNASVFYFQLLAKIK
jgi:hypothetical protein